MKSKLVIIGMTFLIISIVIILAYLLFEYRKRVEKGELGRSKSQLEIVGNEDKDDLPDTVPGILSTPMAQSKQTQLQQAQQPQGSAVPNTSADSTGAQESAINPSKQYSAVLETTEGDIAISFTTSETPITVNNFVTLARKDYYDNNPFHRVIEGFMIQAGSGNPGYSFADEPFEGSYERGVVAMANAGPDTNGSQFFIMHQDYPLESKYVIFGKVTEGMDTVDKIATAPVEGDAPITPAKILNIKIIEE